MRICIVEDEGITLSVLVSVLKNGTSHEVQGFRDPVAAVESCLLVQYDLILLDYMMPGLDGVAFVQKLRARASYASVPIVMITADRNRDIRLRSISAGTTDFLNKPVDPEELKVRVENLLKLRAAQLTLADRARHLSEEIAAATAKIEEREEELILRLSRAIALRDDSTGDHIYRVAAVSRIVAARMGLPPPDVRNIYLAAPLHDIGKIGIPDNILNKKGKFTAADLDVMRSHTTMGGDILSGTSNDLLEIARVIALYHHEKWDGTGYPVGLSSKAIPLPGRIVAIADVFDALSTKRVYKKAWSLADARDEIRRLSGSQFDPACVAAFEAGWPEIVPIYDQHPAAANAAE